MIPYKGAIIGFCVWRFKKLVGAGCQKSMDMTEESCQSDGPMKVEAMNTSGLKMVVIIFI